MPRSFYIGGTMSLLDDILAHNREYVEDQNTGYVETDTKCSKMPSREMAIVTCMDTRLVNFLEDSMDIGRGEAKIVKTAGNRITGPFDGVVRSLLVCIYELGVNEIFIIGHHECGMAKTTAKNLTEKMLARGIAPEAIHMVHKEMERWADGFTHPAENVEDTVDELRMNPLIPKDVPIHGLIFHPRTGEIEVIVNGYTQMKQYYEK